jgi:hypothetical protein
MQELFRKLSTLINFFHEERMPEMAEEAPKPTQTTIDFTDKEAGVVEGKRKQAAPTIQTEQAAARAKMQEMLKNALKGVNAVQASPTVDLNALAANIKATPPAEGLQLKDLPNPETAHTITPDINISTTIHADEAVASAKKARKTAN